MFFSEIVYLQKVPKSNKESLKKVGGTGGNTKKNKRERERKP
jgi:hypothetical protein